MNMYYNWNMYSSVCSDVLLELPTATWYLLRTLHNEIVSFRLIGYIFLRNKLYLPQDLLP